MRVPGHYDTEQRTAAAVQTGTTPEPSEPPTPAVADVVEPSDPPQTFETEVEPSDPPPVPETEVEPSDPPPTAEGTESPDTTEGGEADEGMTKEELYEMAQELDIPGRSKMSRDELEEAINNS